jgi:AAA ATPase domain
VEAQAVYGRDADRACIDRFLAALPGGPAGLVVSGGEGIGKTALWQAAVDAAQCLRYQVLMARPAESEARLSYSGLADLLEKVADEVLPALPVPQRRALEVALLRAGDGGHPPDQRAVSAAMLTALRLLGTQAPVLVAIDDVQWLDPVGPGAAVRGAPPRPVSGWGRRGLAGRPWPARAAGSGSRRGP